MIKLTRLFSRARRPHWGLLGVLGTSLLLAGGIRANEAQDAGSDASAPDASATAAASTSRTSPTAAIEGLWAGERHFGPEVGGDLTIWRQAGVWQAEVAGFKVEVEQAGDRLQFRLPGERGAFRGRWQDGEGEIRGHWIQPSTLSLGQAFATPVRLQQQAAGRWHGLVRPLEDRARWYLRIFRQAQEDGSAVTRAVLRNPEYNVGVFMRINYVTLEGEKVLFRRKDGSTILTGWLTEGENGEANHLLRIHVEGVGISYDLRRTARQRATGFSPHWSETPYRYEPPLAREDGWQVAAADTVGIDPAPLETLVQSIRSAETTSVYQPYIHSMLIAHRGKLVFEEYFYGHGPAETHDTRSSGKSLASMIAGVIIDRHPQLDADTTLQSVFGEAADEPQAGIEEPSYEARSAWRRTLTVGHLLSMSSGLACDDNDEDSPGNEMVMQSQVAQPSWRRYTLDLTMRRAPGERALYCSASINLALGMLQHVTGEWLPETFANGIAEPLGIERYHFNLTPAENGYMGGGIRLVPRDQLKLGQVMIDGGTWNGERVLSREWVADSVAVHASMNEPDDYGYGWWRTELENPATGKRHRVFYASGNGGQLIIGIPDLDLVVQFSAGNYVNFPVWIRFLRELVPQYVLPAVDR